MDGYTLPNIKVREIMSEDVVKVRAESSIKELLDTIEEYEYHSYPVMEEGELVGIVTKTDVIGILERKSLSQIFATHVRDIMKHSPRTISPEADIEKAGKILIKGRFRSLPVIEEGKLVGLVSSTDVTKKIVEREERQS